MKIAKSSSISNDELLTVTNEECNWQVVGNSSGKGSTSVWILDSRCSYHMCSNMSVFDTYEEMKGSKILLADETSCEVLGMGIVKIKMQDDVVRSLFCCIGFLAGGVENSIKEAFYTKKKKERPARNLTVKKPMQQNEATSALKTS